MKPNTGRAVKATAFRAGETGWIFAGALGVVIKSDRGRGALFLR